MSGFFFTMQEQNIRLKMGEHVGCLYYWGIKTTRKNWFFEVFGLDTYRDENLSHKMLKSFFWKTRQTLDGEGRGRFSIPLHFM